MRSVAKGAWPVPVMVTVRPDFSGISDSRATYMSPVFLTVWTVTQWIHEFRGFRAGIALPD